MKRICYQQRTTKGKLKMAYVVSGGESISGISLENDTMTALDGGIADCIAVNSNGKMHVSSGGSAKNTAVNSRGGMFVYSSGMADRTEVFSRGGMFVSSGGTAIHATVFSGGSLHVFTGGVANSVAVNSGGRMILESEGAANNAAVGAGGVLRIESGGQMTSAVVQSDGRLLGYFDCEDVTFESGASLYFDVSGIAPGNTGALVDLAGLSDPETIPFRLMISDSQETGDYKLAAGATGFDRTISVVNDVMELGSVSTDQSVAINGKEYTLSLDDDVLVLSVNAPVAQYVYLDFDGEELVRYSNSDLELAFDLSVYAPAFSEEQRAAIVSELTKQYNKYNIAFMLERSDEDVAYSTLYFGQSPAFADYGDFFGVAETHDGNNRIRNDNAFVLVDESYSQGQIVSVASHMLDHLLGISYFAVDGGPDIRKYAENQTLLSYSSDWTQEDPYNKYCPVDPKNGERSITGCTNNAASQIICYWLEKGMLDLTLTLEDSDAYKCTTGIAIESSDDPVSGHLSFAETNELLSSFKLEDCDCIAALCFAAGVVQKAQYSSVETGAFWNKNLFVRADFDPASVADKYMTVINWPECSESYADPGTRLADDDFMVSEIFQGRPVGISLHSIGHAVVVDGYDSSRNMFHLNFGWGEDKNRWCTLEELVELQVDEAVCGIAPIVFADLAVKDLSVGEGSADPDGNVTLSFSVSNEGTEVSKETFAYVYCGDDLIGRCDLGYVSPGYSRECTCTFNASLLTVGENVLAVKVGTQKDEDGVSEESVVLKKSKWTYMMYFAADNDLDDAALYDLISIQRADIDEEIDVYVLVDRPESPWDWEEGALPTVNGTYEWDSLWTDTRVGRICHDPGLTVTVDWESWGELDTGSAETLDRFVNWVQAESPAENYALVLWDHGEEFATLCYDFTTAPDLSACLTVSDVSGVVKEKGIIPLVIFNSCLNASDIATTQMAGSADVMVAPESPSMSSGATYAYRSFFSEIAADMTAREMAEILVRNVRSTDGLPYPSMLAAIDVTDARLADSLEALADAVFAAGNIEDQNVLIDAMRTAPLRRCLYEGGVMMQSDLYDIILQAKADPACAGASDGFRTALANVEAALDAVVLNSRSSPGDSGYGIGFANTICFSEQYLGLGYTADKTDAIVLDYLTTWYGSNPKWADLLHELARTYLDRNAVSRIAVFDEVENSDLVEGEVVRVKQLGCFSGRGETLDGIALDGAVYFGFTITEADKSSGGFRVENKAGATVSVALLAGDGSVLASGDDSVAFADLAAGDYFIRLDGETNCDVTLSFESDWLTGVDRFDYAGSGSNEKHANGNGTPAEASILGAGYYSGMLTSRGDSDFYQFVNTGTDEVRIAVESSGGNCLNVRAFTPKGIPGTGAKCKEGVYTLTMSVGDRLWVEGDADLNNDQVNAYSITVIPYEEAPVVLSDLSGTKDDVSWKASEVNHQFLVEYSADDFEHVLSTQTSGWGVDTLELPSGTYQWRVKVLADEPEDPEEEPGPDGEWISGNEIVSDNAPGAPKIAQSNADGNADLFFASPVGVWKNSYVAQHAGTLGGWAGTNERVSAWGKGRIQNLFFGSADVNALYLTDSENGDALFVDDVFTGSPESVAEETARLFQIAEVYAGAGDDIVDMTSRRFAYTGDMTAIHGGDGDDVIWANSGDNQLYGDAGNDRIVGASGCDFIVGGVGDDRMHGGGGDDIFTFCENWGNDTVEQLADGSVLLWFASGSMKNWSAETLTYKDGDNSVAVSGVTEDKITLKFGNDWSTFYAEVELAGGFLDFSSRRIFEESGEDVLASGLLG
jgi:autotransporter passenger strand-loop-strand repeat protein